MLMFRTFRPTCALEPSEYVIDFNRAFLDHHFIFSFFSVTTELLSQPIAFSFSKTGVHRQLPRHQDVLLERKRRHTSNASQ